MRKLDTRTIVVASHNAGKIREIRDLIGPLGFEAKSAADLNFIEPDETGTTFEENAAIKALASAKAAGLPALSDDSGLVIDALGGAPGVYTANWAEREDGTRDFSMAMQKVETQRAQASTAKWSTAATIGGTLLGALFGRKGGLTTSVSKVGTAMRESGDVANAEQEVERLRAEMKALDQQLEAETQKIRDQYDPTALVFETAKLTPQKKNITPSAVGILWISE